MLIAARESFAAASRRRLPYDAEIRYLESTGTQYIDTGIPLYSDMQIVVSLAGLTFTENSLLFGSNASTSTSAGQFSAGMFKYQTSRIFSSNYNKTTSSMSGVVYGDGNHEIRKINNQTYYDGTRKLNVTAVARYYAGGTCYIFWAAGYRGGIFVNKATAKIASFLLRDSAGTALFDGHAVRVGSGANAVGYLYDRVSGRLFGNAGTGAFGTGQDIN